MPSIPYQFCLPVLHFWFGRVENPVTTVSNLQAAVERETELEQRMAESNSALMRMQVSSWAIGTAFSLHGKQLQIEFDGML